MSLSDTDKMALDAAIAACDDDDEVLGALVRRHLAEAAYVFAELMAKKISQLPPDIPIDKVRGEIYPVLKKYQDWSFESLLTERLEHLVISCH